jgi:hypothetical protein
MFRGHPQFTPHPPMEASPPGTHEGEGWMSGKLAQDERGARERAPPSARSDYRPSIWIGSED